MSVIERFVPDRVATRALVRLALPIVVVQAGIMLMGVVDTIMVGHISAEALGSVALGNMYYFSISIFGLGVLMALDPIISQAVGAGDHTAIARAMQRAFVIAILLTVVICGFMLRTAPILRFLQQPEEIIPNAA